MATRRRSTKSKSDVITEEDVNAAVAIIQRDYYQDVQGIADDILAAVKSGEITDQEGLEERLQQDVDGSARVIYTFQSKLGLLVCKNDEAYEEEFGEKPADVAVQMAYAMMVDVREALGDIEFED
jgi:hypothetical protein